MTHYEYGELYWITVKGKRFVAIAIGETEEGGVQQFQDFHHDIYSVAVCSDIVKVEEK